MRFVFDTNVLISAALGSSSCRKAIDLAIQKGKLVRSEETFIELAATFEKRKLQKYLNPKDKIDFLANYMLTTQRVEVTAQFSVCRDPKDNMLLELAVSGKAHALITGDKDLLELNYFLGTLILTVDAFIKLMEDSSFKFD
jgi:putative PIN family toxin of toxin-antitoxin system